MNLEKEKDETNGYRNTNGKESDDAEEYLTTIFRTGELRLPLKSE